MRQIVLDTETTGLEVSQGHRIIEIGCVELLNRRLTGNHYHQYINPQREIDQGAIEVHGITNEFLGDKPRFEQGGAEFLEYVTGAELIIHNAPFDLGFINAELKRLDPAHPDLETLYAMYFPSLSNSRPERATVPSSEKVFGSSSTSGVASREAWMYITDWFCMPSFLKKK